MRRLVSEAHSLIVFPEGHPQRRRTGRALQEGLVPRRHRRRPAGRAGERDRQPARHDQGAADGPPGRRPGDDPRSPAHRRHRPPGVIAFAERVREQVVAGRRRFAHGPRRPSRRRCDNRRFARSQPTGPDGPRPMYVTAIIAAGGAGHRLGAGVPKQLLDVGGRSILQRSVDAFAAHPEVDDVIVALPPELVDAPPLETGRRAGASGWWRAAPAGRTRWRTRSGRSTRSTDIVLVHDAARPFVTGDLISKADPGGGRARRGDRGAAGERHGQAGPPRRRIGWRWSKRFRASRSSWRRRRRRFASTCWRTRSRWASPASRRPTRPALAERAGHAVHIVEATATNMKITTTDDLAEARRRFARRADSHHGRTGRHRLRSAPAGRGPAAAARRRRRFRRRAARSATRMPTWSAMPRPTPSSARRRSATSAGTFPDIGSAVEGRVEPRSAATRGRDGAHRRFPRRQRGRDRRARAAEDCALSRPDPRRSSRARSEVPVERVSVKGKTNEGVDAVGRGEAIAAHAVALLRST